MEFNLQYIGAHDYVIHSFSGHPDLSYEEQHDWVRTYRDRIVTRVSRITSEGKVSLNFIESEDSIPDICGILTVDDQRIEFQMTDHSIISVPNDDDDELIDEFFQSLLRYITRIHNLNINPETRLFTFAVFGLLKHGYYNHFIYSFSDLSESPTIQIFEDYKITSISRRTNYGIITLDFVEIPQDSGLNTVCPIKYDTAVVLFRSGIQNIIPEELFDSGPHCYFDEKGLKSIQCQYQCFSLSEWTEIKSSSSCSDLYYTTVPTLGYLGMKTFFENSIRELTGLSDLILL